MWRSAHAAYVPVLKCTERVIFSTIILLFSLKRRKTIHRSLWKTTTPHSTLGNSASAPRSACVCICGWSVTFYTLIILVGEEVWRDIGFRWLVLIWSLSAFCAGERNFNPCEWVDFEVPLWSICSNSQWPNATSVKYVALIKSKPKHEWWVEGWTPPANTFILN